jgi:hypothetical protein
VASALEESSTDEKVALAPALWLDPDVRWLTGVHEAEGHAYLVREQYEELLWWLLMPSLLRFAAEPAPSRSAVEELRKTVEEALASAKAAGYRIEALLGAATPSVVDEAEPQVQGDEAKTIEQQVPMATELKLSLEETIEAEEKQPGSSIHRAHI